MKYTYGCVRENVEQPYLFNVLISGFFVVVVAAVVVVVFKRLNAHKQKHLEFFLETSLISSIITIIQDIDDKIRF